MLYKNSTNPIEVKKIPLKIWTLRSHLEAFIKKYLKNIEYDYLTPDEITALFKIYYNESFLLEHFPNLIDNFSIPPIIRNSSNEDDESKNENKKNNVIDNKEITEENLLSNMNDNPISDLNNSSKSQKKNINANKNKQKDEDQDVDEDEDQDENEDEDQEVNNELLIIPLRPPIDENHLARGKTFISDITMKRISFFGTKNYLPGQAIIIEFDVPNNFTISAEVLHCENYNLHSRVISEDRPKYRIHATFPFTRRGERTILRNFIKSIETQIKK
ncbi:MAG: hypothetical protein HQK51_09630 [Oligoflexia bacterium]|nr:hypothetical protein [Oligoflexia bacterium]